VSIFNDYKDHADFLTVYVREAHPTDEWQMKSNIKDDVCYAQPRNLSDRLAIANDFAKRYKYPVPFGVDDMNNAANDAYAAWPERLYIIDENGKIAYRGGNGPNLQTTYGPDSYFIGPEQLAWLKRALLNSRATWKVIASDMPLSIIVYDDATNKKGSEAFAQGDGPPRGRELEIADLLRFIKSAGISNTVWLTADVHYAAAHYYDPNKAQFQDFEPFWEFVAGPFHAGTFGPNELDNTFGPEVKFIKTPGADKQNLPPSAGMQFFGHVKIDGASGQLTVTLRDRADVALWSTTLDPKPG